MKYLQHLAHGIVCVFVLTTWGVHGIINGSLLVPNAAPYQVSLRLNNSHFCGGALITARHVVTSARCVCFDDYDLRDLRIVSGSNSLQNGGNASTVVAVSCHEEYNFTNNNVPSYDIAVITLKQAITTSPYQRPVAILPRKEVLENWTQCIFTGWGATRCTGNLSLVASPTLRGFTMVIPPRKECLREVPERYEILPNHLCAKKLNASQNAGSYIGDFGGPLVCSDQLVGILNEWILCGSEELPEVFTSIQESLAFIETVVPTSELYASTRTESTTPRQDKSYFQKFKKLISRFLNFD